MNNHQRNFFITYCMKHPNVFGSMLQLKTKENMETVVEDLRKKNLEQLHEQKRKLSTKLKILYTKLIVVQNKSTMASFDEKVSMCLENIVEFADIINVNHNFNDTFKCDLEDCELKMFSDELLSSVHSKRRSPRLAKIFFLGLCKKYPKTFDDAFLIARNKNLYFNLIKK